MPERTPQRVFITAAEVSGDQHAGHLIACLRKLNAKLMIEGVGGPAMAGAGASILHESTRRAAMMHQAVARAGEMWGLFRRLKRYFDDPATRPDLQICVDSPAMNFHIAKIAHERRIPVLYYVAPQTWAWREGRVEKLRKWVDKVACILPFEEPYFRSHGVDATFVGHPLFDQLPPERGPAPGARFPDRPPVIGLLPGSRRSEATLNFPHMLEIAEQIRGRYPDATFLVPTTPATHPVVEEHARNIRSLRYEEGKFDEMVPACDLCLTVSGTATLHVACYGIPMVVVYRGSKVLWHAVGRWIMQTRTFALVNLLSNAKDPSTHVVPEFVPWYGPQQPVGEVVLDFLEHPEKMRAQQARVAQLVRQLDRPGASMKVAHIALAMLAGRLPRRGAASAATVMKG